MMLSSRTRLVEAISNAMAAVKLAPLRNSERPSATGVRASRRHSDWLFWNVGKRTFGRSVFVAKPYRLYKGLPYRPVGLMSSTSSIMTNGAICAMGA
jgi:hypothetical protein